jgi:hypothetical protein
LKTRRQKILKNILKNLLILLKKDRKLEAAWYIGKFYIYCLSSAAGVSRSASIIIGYLMTENRWSLIKSYKFVLQKREIVYPNWGFQKQLRKLEIKLGLISKRQFEKESKEKTSFIDNI